MPNLTTKLINEFSEIKSKISKIEEQREKLIDKITHNDIIQDYFKKTCTNCRWHITGINICDDDINPKVVAPEKEWVEISEEEYYESYINGKLDDENYRIEYEYEPEFKERYFKYQTKKHKYLRIYVHESWSYGVNDDISHDFLLSDIMDKKDLRKEKLKKLMEA